jgi:tetratricopeptide (TPR) repeat protein
MRGRRGAGGLAAGYLFGACLLGLVGWWPSPAGAAPDEPRPSAPASQNREDPDYTAGVAAIKANDYAKAIPLFERVVARDDKNANAFNWLGYATRKAGDPAKSIPIYEKALAIDPNHKGAHEYIGEAYLLLDNPAKAKEHLARLNKLCFFPCGEYTDLKKAVEAYEAKNKGKSSSR